MAGGFTKVQRRKERRAFQVEGTVAIGFQLKPVHLGRGHDVLWIRIFMRKTVMQIIKSMHILSL